MSAQTAIGASAAGAVVIANMIGTGVFTSLGYQVTGISSPFAILALWTLGGLIAICGALVYAEFGARMPRSGGEYHLLSRIYHPALGFLAGFLSIAVGFAAPVAAAAIAMASYLTSATGATDSALSNRIIAVTTVTLVTLVHLSPRGTISLFQVSFTLLKVLMILIFIVAGFALAAPQPISFAVSPRALSETVSPDFAISLVFVMYAYSGWNAAIYIASEIHRPERNVPIALIGGTLIVTILYTLLNAVFLYSAPMTELAGQTEVGYIAAQHIFGETLGAAMGLLIAFGLISTISAMTWAGPRVLHTMSEDYGIFSAFKPTNRNAAPHRALLFQLAIVIGLVLTSSFEAILVYIGFTLSLSVFLTVGGIFVVRSRDPVKPAHYLTWGYPWIPLLFLLMTGWMLIYLLKEKPFESLIGLGTLLTGLLLYALDRRLRLAPARAIPSLVTD